MKFLVLLLLLLFSAKAFEQNTDKIKITTDTIHHHHKSISAKPHKIFKADLSAISFPDDTVLYKQIFHNPPVCQGNTGTCWCFASTSFFESEIFRVSGKKVKLSEMFSVYWEYMERAVDFVRTHGQTYVNEGSEASALIRLYQKYGIVPLSAYEGKPAYRKIYSHRELIKSIQNFLDEVKKNNIWDENYVISTVKSLLNAEMGVPPEKFMYDGKEYTPKSFLREYLKISPAGYFRFMSTEYFPYNEKHELTEDDNWWHDKEFYNVSPDTFVKLINKSLEKNFSVCLCGDVSEAGYDHNEQKVAVVPKFDVPDAQINGDSRELRLQNSSTTDDHCIHIIGYYEKEGKFWYLIKDSNGNTFDGKYPGYRFYDEDYIKLKMMNILIQGDAARWYLDKMIK